MQIDLSYNEISLISRALMVMQGFAITRGDDVSEQVWRALRKRIEAQVSAADDGNGKDPARAAARDPAWVAAEAAPRCLAYWDEDE